MRGLPLVRFACWGSVLHVSSVQVNHQVSEKLEPLETFPASGQLLDPQLQGSIAAALETIAEDQKFMDSDQTVFMQDGMSLEKEKVAHGKAAQRMASLHSPWELVTEELVARRFGDNSTAARGLRALLGEAVAAEASMSDWQHLAFAIASLTPKDVLAKEAGPAQAFPARHVASRPGASQAPHPSSFRSDDALERNWNEWTLLCLVGLIAIMLTSVITANKRRQPGHVSRLLELETRWRLTGSSAAGSLQLLRQAAEAVTKEEPVCTSSEDLGVWDGTVALFSCLVGTGLLAMPYAFSLAGMVAAPLVVFFVGCSAYTAHLMVWAMQAEAARQCLPSGSRTARVVTIDWAALVNAAFGPSARKAVEIFLIVELWGYLLSTAVCASMNVAQLLDLSSAPAVALAVCGAYSLTFVPAKVLTKINVMSNLVFIASALMFLITGLLLPQKAPASDVEMIRPKGLLAAAGILIFSPAGHSFYPRIIQQMEEPQKFSSCIKWAYAAACAVYLAIAVPGYYLFGSAAQPSAVRNIGVDRQLMPLPDLWWMNTAAALGLVVKLIPNQALVLSPLTAVIKGALARRLSESTAEVAQAAVTPVVLLVSALLAVHFANEMAFLLNLLGSFFCMNIAFVLPVICYWRLASETLSFGRQLLFGALIAMGLGGAVLGVISCL
mmetsp:Transcript_40704/g.75759  ORF Transcript_40704/g.75759 Transcript_40704/m.75759 type:complete len:668 (+) Transcript_40704:143-2146(+)